MPALAGGFVAVVPRNGVKSNAVSGPVVPHVLMYTLTLRSEPCGRSSIFIPSGGQKSKDKNSKIIFQKLIKNEWKVKKGKLKNRKIEGKNENLKQHLKKM